MTSHDAINPTRSRSSLSRALVQNEKSKGSSLLEGRITNGCVFNTTILSSSEDITSNNTDVELLQELTSIIFGQMPMNNRDKKLARETTEKVREIVVDYINQKTT